MTRQDEIRQAEAIFEGCLRRIGPGDLAVDCGANKGAITRKLAGTGARVIAYEPDPIMFARLQAAFGDDESVELRAVAVGLAAGEAELFRSPYYDSNPDAESEKNTICPDALTRDRAGGWRSMDIENTVRVPVVDLLASPEAEIETYGRIALVKLDIEGMEVPILREMDRRSLFDHIDLTIAELHPWRFPDQADEIADLRRQFAAAYAQTHVNLGWG